MKIIFMGTPAFALPALEKLLQAGHEVVAVYSQPPRPAGRGQKETPSPIHRFAQEHHLRVYTPTTLRTPEVQAEFADLKADVAIVAAYGLLLPPLILTACPYGCINIHPSLLPRWRGAAPIERPLLAGDKETGVTLMQMDKGLDTGDMLMVKPLPITAEDTAQTLHDRLAELGGEMLVELLALLPGGIIHPLKQPEEGVTYAAKITKEEAHIPWHVPATDIERMIRAFNPRPGAYFFYKGERIKVVSATALPFLHNASPGMVLDEQLTIACGEGSALQPVLLQRAGKGTTERDAFLRGFPIRKDEQVT